MMSDDPRNRRSENEPDIDAGEPVRVLAGLEQEPTATFLHVVRRKIHRRSTTSQFLSFSWKVPQLILLEFWNMLVQILSSRPTQKGGQS
jgi:hypothetical protein